MGKGSHVCFGMIFNMKYLFRFQYVLCEGILYILLLSTDVISQ
jgi:hypothetical protein